MADRAVGIPIVREGFPFVAATGGPAVMAGALGWTVPALVLGAIALFTAWFFRNPRRLVPDGARAVVAPGGGRVMAIEQEYEPRFLKEQGIRRSIFLGTLDVHVNRIPFDGKVEDIGCPPAPFL